ncbi:MAG: S1 family peptidase [Methanosarcinales archaeon]|jgi:hypothetical protein|nr:S1 family peptidase [Methanosarcinales archaeon]
MNKNMIKLSLLICFVFLGMLIPVYGTEDIRKSDTGLEYEEVLKIIDNNTATNPDLLNELSKQDNILAVYGTIPKKSSGVESYEWWLTLDSVAKSISKDEELLNSQYFSGIGAYTAGYLFIQILEENKDFVKTEDLEAMKKIVEKHAEMYGIQDVPLVIKVVKPAISFAANPNSYVKNPLGGLHIETNTSGGTLGYAVKFQNNFSKKGMVTVAHVLHFTSRPVYQSTSGIGSHLLGTPTSMNNSYDCVFIPETNTRKAQPYICDGAGNDLKVVGSAGSVSHNMLVEKSGSYSGFSQGYYIGTLYRQNFSIPSSNYTVETVGILEEKNYNPNLTVQKNVSIKGDSGGPVFSKFGSNAVMFGILEGGDGNGTAYFVYCNDIRDSLGVVPLT